MGLFESSHDKYINIDTKKLSESEKQEINDLVTKNNVKNCLSRLFNNLSIISLFNN